MQKGRCVRPTVWPKEKVISRIRQLFQADTPLNCSYLMEHHLGLYSAMKKRFGSRKRALKAARIDPKTIKVFCKPKRLFRIWTREKIVQVIQKLSQKKKLFQVKRKRADLYQAALKYCGGWLLAVQLAGVPYPSRPTRPQKDRPAPVKKTPVWSSGIVVEEIRRRYQAGEKLNYVVADSRLVAAARRYFSTWRNAIEAAGISYAGVRVLPDVQWTKEKVAVGILFRRSMGLPLNPRAMSQHDVRLYSAAYMCFGRKSGWKKALRAAGIDPKTVRPPRKQSPEIVVREITTLWHMGQRLDFTSMLASGHGALIAAANVHCGSWAKAVRRAGFLYGKIRRSTKKWWTPRRVVYHIQRLERHGIRLSSKFMHDNYSTIHSAGQRYFGSWSQAVYAAGIDYRVHCKTWSSKAWLRNLQTRDIEVLRKRTTRLAKRQKGKK